MPKIANSLSLSSFEASNHVHELQTLNHPFTSVHLKSIFILSSLIVYLLCRFSFSDLNASDESNSNQKTVENSQVFLLLVISATK